MNRTNIFNLPLACIIFCLAVAQTSIASATVPLQLPRPDGSTGDQTKPVQVYILAGQSNMVGMGDLSGARPLYPSIYLTPDPDVIPGRMPVGASALKQLEVTGAKAHLYAGDTATGTPAKTLDVPLGDTSATLPALPGKHALRVTATITVPATGKYQIHPGFGDSADNVAVIDGQEVYRKDPGGKPIITTIKLEQDKPYSIVITYTKSGSAAFWMEQIGLEGRGDLETVVRKDGKYTWLVDDEGNWSNRMDVTYSDARIAKDINGQPLSATANQGHKSIGPELGFGFVMGEFHDEQVLLIKTAMGNRALGFDFRPPSSGRTDPDSKWEGLEYRLMVEGVRKTLANIDKVVPDYKGQGYKIAGFCWFQGHKDGGSPQAEYEKHLVNLINDVRKEFNEPKMPAVVAAVGFGGWRIGEKHLEILNAQLAVGDPQQHPEFAGTVASVDIRDFWREVIESPRGQDYHYNRNAETYWLIGDAMGRAMIGLKGGQAEPRPATNRKAKAMKMMAQAKRAAENKPTEAQEAASLAAIKPLIVDGVLASFLANERNAKSIADVLSGKRPGRWNQFPRDIIDTVSDYYLKAGDGSYLWQDFGPDLKNGSWEYFSFDPADGKQGEGYRKVALPAGMEEWFVPQFDTAKAGFKTGTAPFAQRDGKLVAIGGCEDNYCRCGVKPKTLWEKEVLLIRKTVKLPALQPGYRYRILLGGASHVNGGEGFALYVDGKQVAESNSGVGKRQGGQPRGVHVYDDFKPALADGEVTLGVMAFLRYKHPRDPNYPPTGHISVWIEQQKIPPVQ